MRLRGRVTAVTGPVVRAVIPEARVGDVFSILRAPHTAVLGEVVGFADGEVLMMLLGDTLGIGPGSEVERVASQLIAECGSGLLGRVVDASGRPIDSAAGLAGKLRCWPLHRPPPAPLSRQPINKALDIGVRAIDAFITVGQGQRLGLFAPAGVGKSTLLGQLCSNCSADVRVVCLVGERGREVRDFVHENISFGQEQTVVVCATSDEPPLRRIKSVELATAYAEFFREQGKSVLLLVDSLTRYARALRDVGLAAGELPARRGYPPSVFSTLPRLIERAGTAATGSITAVYTVLVEGDGDDPIADELRGLLDGHIVLSRRLAERGHYPAIDVLASLSRVMPAVTSLEHRQAAQRVRERIALYEDKRDLIALGAYQRGSDARLDRAIACNSAINEFLRQAAEDSPSSVTTALEDLRALAVP